MSESKVFKLGFVIVMLITMLFNSQANVFAAINSNYDKGSEVQESDLDKKVSDSVVLEALGSFIYAVASMAEYAVGVAFKGLTGENSFPWADRVIFNAVPMLDINFFNPSSGSMFKTKANAATPLSDIIRNTYFTILAIAISFLSIVVAISAIKLALSSIASEKAKYKEALSKWLFSIVMLFLMHNLMSFVFFVNEKMVEVASGMLAGQLENANFAILKESSVDSNVAVKNFVEANSKSFVVKSETKDVINTNSDIAYSLLDNSNYQDSVLKLARDDTSKGFRNWVFSTNGNEALEAIARDIKFIKNGQSEDVYVIGVPSITLTMKDLEDYISNQATIGANATELNNSDVYKYFQKHVNMIDGISNLNSRSFAWASAVYKAYKKANGIGEADPQENLIGSIAQYLKESAYTLPTDKNGYVTGWKRSKLTIQGALLYGIFVAQSIFYFFSYLRRFFYIIVLAMMAPAIVLLDFLGKSLA